MTIPVLSQLMSSHTLDHICRQCGQPIPLPDYYDEWGDGEEDVTDEGETA